MHVLITGSEGFLGRRLVTHLTGKGLNVLRFDIALGQDLLRYEDLTDVVRGIPVGKLCVVHLAAVANLYFFGTDPEGCRKINVEGTRNVLKLCAEVGARLLFASTCCCYGNNDCHPSTEDSPLAPTEPYARSKAESEVHVLDASSEHVIMRLATFYGPGMRGALCPAVFIDRAHKQLPIEIHGSGEQTRTFTYVDDIVSGIATLVSAEKLAHQIYNVTSEEAVAVLRIAEIARDITGHGVEIRHVADRPGQIFKEEISNERLRSLGWEPATSFGEGMRLAYADYLEHDGMWVQSEGVGSGR